MTSCAAARTMLERLWRRGREFLGTETAIMGGAMTWVSERNLVAAISEAGGFGVIASGAMTPERLAEEIQATQALTSAPFGVNLITMHPQLLELVEACLDHRVGHVVLAGGLPPAPAMVRIRQGGARLVCFAPALSLARKLVRSGAEAIDDLDGIAVLVAAKMIDDLQWVAVRDAIFPSTIPDQGGIRDVLPHHVSSAVHGTTDGRETNGCRIR